MAKIFLAAVSLMYAGLSVWCIVSPQTTSAKVGFKRVPGQGESEFLVIYGGLQLALAILFALPLFRESTLFTVLTACLIVHGCLAVTRLAGFMLYSGFPAITYQLAAGEWILLIASAGFLWYQSGAETP